MLDAAVGNSALEDEFLVHLELPLARNLAVPATPVFITNNKDDLVINPTCGHEAETVLGNLGFKVCFQQYPEGGHEINEPNGWDAIQEFLKQRVD